MTSAKLCCYEAKPGLYEKFMVKEPYNRHRTFSTKSKAN